MDMRIDDLKVEQTCLQRIVGECLVSAPGSFGPEASYPAPPPSLMPQVLGVA